MVNTWPGVPATELPARIDGVGGGPAPPEADEPGVTDPAEASVAAPSMISETTRTGQTARKRGARGDSFKPFPCAETDLDTLDPRDRVSPGPTASEAPLDVPATCREMNATAPRIKGVLRRRKGVSEAELVSPAVCEVCG